jgi:hypothetical protein
MNPLWFNIVVKSGLYGYGLVPPLAAGIWAYEATTGKDVPFLVEMGAYAAVSVGAGSIDEALTRAWNKYGYKTTKGVVRRLSSTGLASARAMARGSVRLLTTGGMRVVPVIGAAYFAHKTITHYGSYHHFFSSLGHEARKNPLAMPIISPF